MPNLVVWDNSFQTLVEADAILAERVDCLGYSAAVQAKKEASLIQSFRALTKLSFAVSTIRGGDPFNLLDLEDTPIERQAIPTAMLRDLKTAQLIYADQLLGGSAVTQQDQILQKREAGILEERVGESAVVFAPAGGSRSVIPRRALDVLTGWLYVNMRLARA